MLKQNGAIQGKLRFVKTLEQVDRLRWKCYLIRG